jgi:hypothetical protein
MLRGTRSLPFLHFFPVVLASTGRVICAWIVSDLRLSGQAGRQHDRKPPGPETEKSRFQRPLPEIERHPYLTLSPSLLKKKSRFRGSQLGRKSRRIVSRRTLLWGKKIKMFPDLTCSPNTHSVISTFRDCQMKVAK